MKHDLSRFIEIQEKEFQYALEEIQIGIKLGHWMWYIFPQIHDLGTSPTSKYYAIQSYEEAVAYLNNEYLYTNLIKICNALLNLPTNNPIEIFGSIDAQKLRSSITLFDYVSKKENKNISIFQLILNKYFNNQIDSMTIKILENEKTKTYALDS